MSVCIMYCASHCPGQNNIVPQDLALLTWVAEVRSIIIVTMEIIVMTVVSSQ